MVHDHGHTILGNRDTGYSSGYAADAPVIHLRGVAFLGSVEVKRPSKSRIGRMLKR